MPTWKAPYKSFTGFFERANLNFTVFKQCWNIRIFSEPEELAYLPIRSHKIDLHDCVVQVCWINTERFNTWTQVEPGEVQLNPCWLPKCPSFLHFANGYSDILIFYQNVHCCTYHVVGNNIDRKTHGVRFIRWSTQHRNQFQTSQVNRSFMNTNTQILHNQIK